MRVDVKHICVPTDFSDVSDHAVHYGAAMAHFHGADLHLLHVLERADPLVHHPDFTAHGEVARDYFRRLELSEGELPVAEEFDEARGFLKQLEDGVTDKLMSLDETWWKQLDVRRAVRYGHPVEEICHYANHYGIDLLVLGTHGRGGLARILLGSVAERVVRLSPCPVLLVRHPDHGYALVE